MIRCQIEVSGYAVSSSPIECLAVEKGKCRHRVIGDGVMSASGVGQILLYISLTIVLNELEFVYLNQFNILQLWPAPSWLVQGPRQWPGDILEQPGPLRAGLCSCGNPLPCSHAA